MEIRADYFICKLSQDPWGMSTDKVKRLEVITNCSCTEILNEKRTCKVKFVVREIVPPVSARRLPFSERALKLFQNDEAIREHNHNYDKTCHFSLHLLFNPSLKIASIPSHSGTSNTLSSRTGFLRELSNLRTTAIKREKDPTSQDQKFGREIFSEAMQSYFWDCWDKSLYAESSSEGNAVEKRNVVQFSLPKRSSAYILVRISRAQFPTLTSQSTNSLFSLYMSMVIRLERLHK